MSSTTSSGNLPLFNVARAKRKIFFSSTCDGTFSSLSVGASSASQILISLVRAPPRQS
jgi:hypothetical protein